VIQLLTAFRIWSHLNVKLKCNRQRTASFRRALFLTRVPKGTGRFLMRRLADLTFSINKVKVETEICLVSVYVSVL